MFIAIVDFATSPADQIFAVQTLLAEAPVVRALWGNLGYTVRVNPENPGGMTLIHEWTDMASFTAYRETPGFKAVGALLFPKMVGTPNTRLFEASPHLS